MNDLKYFYYQPIYLEELTAWFSCSVLDRLAGHIVPSWLGDYYKVYLQRAGQAGRSHCSFLTRSILQGLPAACWTGWQVALFLPDLELTTRFTCSRLAGHTVPSWPGAYYKVYLQRAGQAGRSHCSFLTKSLLQGLPCPFAGLETCLNRCLKLKSSIILILIDKVTFNKCCFSYKK